MLGGGLISAVAAGIAQNSSQNSRPNGGENSGKRISVRGDFLVYAVDEFNPAGEAESEFSRIEREIVINNIRYKAEVYGRRETMTTKLDIPLSGTIVGDTFFVDEAPARILDSAELAAKAAENPESAMTVASSEIAAEIGGAIVGFSGKAAFDQFVREQIEWEAVIAPERPAANKGGEQAQTAESTASTWTEGAKTVLLIRVDFSDRPGEPVDQGGVALSAAAAQNLINNSVNQFYVNNSYNKTSLQATVTPVVRMPQTLAYYAANGNFPGMWTDARAAARAAGFDSNNYNFDITAFSYTSSIGWAGLATIGGKGNLLNGAFVLPVVAHELGHNYGLLHANLWRTTDGTAIGAGTNVEYGDCYDFMGACFNQSANSHFNTHYKRRLDWLTDANVQTVTGSGTYRISAQDSSSLSGIKTLKIAKDPTRNYWIEFRQTLSGNVLNGALIHWDYASQNYRETQLLDMNPATTSLADAPLLIGQSFYDAASQIRITVVGKGLTSPESLDVRVEFGSGGGTTPTPTPTPNPTPTPIFCTYALSPNSASATAAGGARSVIVIAPGGCAWTAASNSSWISINGSAGGSGSGTLVYAVQPNTSSEGRSGSLVIAGQIFYVFQDGGGTISTRRSQFDFDGDNKSDLSIFRPSAGEWWFQKSSNGGSGAFGFGAASDKLVPADYTGDGKTDIAFYRPATGEWFVMRSENSSFYSFPFGANGDVPAPADYDGDGKADAAVFRSSTATWYISRSTGGTTIQQFGANGDVPVVADYDGDNKADIAIYRPSVGEWWLSRSTAGVIAFQFGSANDKPVPNDFTGDGKADAAFFRPATGEWFVLRSENQSYYSAPFGTIGDIPTSGDYDGDGRADFAVFRPSTNYWYVQRSSAGTLIQAFGQFGDKPVPSAFTP